MRRPLSSRDVQSEKKRERRHEEAAVSSIRLIGKTSCGGRCHHKASNQKKKESVMGRPSLSQYRLEMWIERTRRQRAFSL